ncbi:MAG: hypothetical protein CSB44_01635 [Gammaproteobacteria bacterium]|nr:MAG: hypothetical protein CSB44_01635 [Gammaproteobacteria bacterium]
MSESDIETRFLAGGMMPADTEIGAAFGEHVVARSYGGAALGDRLVVNLSADRLGPADDLAMSFVGLEPVDESGVLAVRGRRVLGFAAWASINHPKDAGVAFSLVKKLKTIERGIRSKPMRAWKGIQQLEKELAEQYSHFLPSYWEEVARIYKRIGNTKYASTAFNRSLETERAHGLPVDRERRRDTVIEFALAGCISVKALSDYGRDLSKQFSPEEAFDTYREIMLRRTLGGLPPTKGGINDLKRLARAAGRKPDDEVDAVLRTLLPAPSMSRVRRQFWLATSRRLARLASSDDTVAAWLVALIPFGSHDEYEGSIEEWLDWLGQWKALRVLSLSSDEWPGDVVLPGGLSGWFARLIRDVAVPPPALFDLLEAAAPRLIEEGVPLDLWPEGHISADVDLVEACLDLGIPLGEIHPSAELSFSGWCLGERDHPRRHATLDHLFAHSSLRRHLYRNAGRLFGRGRGKTMLQAQPGREPETFEIAAVDNANAMTLARDYLHHLIDRLHSGALGDYEKACHRLQEFDLVWANSHFGDLLESLHDIDTAAVLQRTLQGGVLEEYHAEPLTWQQADVAGDPMVRPSVSGPLRLLSPFPSIVAMQGLRLVQYSANEEQVLGDWPATAPRALGAIPLPDDTLVLFGLDRYLNRIVATWLSAPDKQIPVKRGIYHNCESPMLTVGTGVFQGEKTLYPGDGTISDVRQFLADGEQVWRVPSGYMSLYGGDKDLLDGSVQLELVDTDSGRTIGEGIPPWFEEQLPDDATILWRHCQWLPVPGLEQSALGLVDGTVGWRVIREADDSFSIRGIDGRSYRFAAADFPFEWRTPVPEMMFEQPAGDGFWVIADLYDVVESCGGLCIDSLRRTRAGGAEFLPYDFPYGDDRHFLRVLSETSSAKLRRIDADAAAALLEKARAVRQEALQDAGHWREGQAMDALQSLVRRLLPEAPDSLVHGVVRVAHTLAVFEDRLVRAVGTPQQNAS